MRANPDSIISGGHQVEGLVAGSGSLHVLGTVVGDVRLEGTLIVDAGGRVEGSVEAEHIMVAGVIDGQVVAHDLLEVAEGGTLAGSCATPRLLVAEGGRLEARVNMSGQGGAAVPRAAQPQRPAPRHERIITTPRIESRVAPSDLDEVVTTFVPGSPRVTTPAIPRKVVEAAAAAVTEAAAEEADPAEDTDGVQDDDGATVTADLDAVVADEVGDDAGGDGDANEPTASEASDDGADAKAAAEEKPAPPRKKGKKKKKKRKKSADAGDAAARPAGPPPLSEVASSGRRGKDS